MPHCSCKENVLGETKPCESHKKCANFCKIDCCPVEEPVDCCTPAYLRLEKLRTTWSQQVMGSESLPAHEDQAPDEDDPEIIPNITDNNNVNITTASGDNIPVPYQSIFQSTDLNGVGLATPNEPSGGDEFTISLDLAYAAYLFANTLRYSVSQECGKKDQVLGWLFDTSDENLEVFQSIPEFNLTTSVNRETLLNITEQNITRAQRKQLAGLNLLYKLSIKALAKNTIPRREGNIVNVCDKTGQKWTIAINKASSLKTASTTQFVIVAVPSC
jgi:hypothetical protein